MFSAPSKTSDKCTARSPLLINWTTSRLLSSSIHTQIPSETEMWLSSTSSSCTTSLDCTLHRSPKLDTCFTTSSSLISSSDVIGCFDCELLASKASCVIWTEQIVGKNSSIHFKFSRTSFLCLLQMLATTLENFSVGKLNFSTHQDTLDSLTH